MHKERVANKNLFIIVIMNYAFFDLKVRSDLGRV